MKWLKTLLQRAGIVRRPLPVDDPLTPEQRAAVEECRWWYPEVAEVTERLIRESAAPRMPGPEAAP